MYISKLSLYGFKSFLKKSEIIFGDGITSVVGPNGCGKTNIVDAIRWVIGEQKSRILRADRNSDVIFNGTSKRRAVNLAEVSLTIHNVSGKIPVDYTDIEITRRVYRNGESEYFINKNLCRLKDITNLFIDTGMGANAYSVIELKMIEDILSEAPEERKRLFEEAAGVNKYRVSRKAAMRKLEATKEDLVRLNDIIGEVEVKVKSLKRQLRRYEKYQQTTKKLIEAEVALTSRRVFEIRKKIDPIFDDLKIKKSKLLKAKKSLDTQETIYSKQQKKIQESEIILEKKNETLNQIKTLRNEFQTKELLLKEQHNNTVQNLSRLENTIQSLKTIISSSEGKIASLKKRRDEVKLVLDEKQAKFKKISGEQEVIETKYNKFNSDIQELQEKRYSLIKEQAQYSARYNNLEENIKLHENEMQDYENQIREKSEAQKIISEKQNQIKEKIAKYDEELTEFRESLEEDKVAHSQLTEVQKKIFKEQRIILSELDKLSNKIDFYSSIIQSKEGFDPGLQYILDNLSDFPGIKGALSDILSVDPQFYLAVEAVLKDISRLIIADNSSTALTTLEKLSSLGKGQVSIIPLDIDFKSHQSNSINNNKLIPLSNFIKCSSSLENLKEFLFSNIYCCKDSQFNELLKDSALSDISIVSDKGRCRDARGVFFGGSATSESGSLVGRTEKLYDFENKYDEYSSQKSGIDDELEKIRKNIKLSDANQKELQGNINSYEKELHQKEMDLRKNEQNLFQLNSQLKNLKESRIAAQVAVKNFKEKLSRENPEKNELTEKLSKIDADIAIQNEETQKIKSQLDEKNREIQNQRIEVINLDNEYKNIFDTLEATKISIENQGKKMDFIIGEFETTKEKKIEIENKIKLNNENLGKAREKVNIAESETHKFRDAYQKMRTDLQEINDGLYKLRREKEILSGELKKLELQSTNFASQEKELCSVLKEKYDREIFDELSEDLIREDEGQRVVDRMKRQIELIGMVNMAVKDEFNEEDQRLSFLKEQSDDLIESESALNEVISQIDKIAREQYLETFSKVRKNFQSTFSILFGGGEADVQLIGDSDPLEAKIEIVACPGGKKLQSLRMLSAGEKTLTAIALLFGIYQVKPSPFCILDEVDAPLDDQNTRRFTNLIKTFSGETQFIVVTHNKITMSFADTLYGVTMVEKGISQIVSVRLD